MTNDEINLTYLLYNYHINVESSKTIHPKWIRNNYWLSILIYARVFCEISMAKIANISISERISYWRRNMVDEFFWRLIWMNKDSCNHTIDDHVHRYLHYTNKVRKHKNIQVTEIIWIENAAFKIMRRYNWKWCTTYHIVFIYILGIHLLHLKLLWDRQQKISVFLDRSYISHCQ